MNNSVVQNDIVEIGFGIESDVVVVVADVDADVVVVVVAVVGVDRDFSRLLHSVLTTGAYLQSFSVPSSHLVAL